MSLGVVELESFLLNKCSYVHPFGHKDLYSDNLT
jgi:hypothetical protein